MHTRKPRASGVILRRLPPSAIPALPGVEDHSQRSIAAYLTLVRQWVGGMEFHHSPNEDAKANRWATFMGRMATDRGTQAGWPDFEVLLRGGQILFIELKTDRGRERGSQGVVHGALVNLGFTVYLLRGDGPFAMVMEVRTILMSHGMPKLPMPMA